MFRKAFVINYRTLRSCKLSRRRSAKFALGLAMLKKVVLPMPPEEAEQVYKVSNGMQYALKKEQ